MFWKQTLSSKNEQIFPDYPVKSEKARPSKDTFTAQKRITKHDWIRFILKLCQIILNICSSAYDKSAYSLIIYYKVSRVVYATRHLFWALGKHGDGFSIV